MSLYGHWNFNENDNTKVIDYSTNARDATAITALTIVAGELGYAASFNGTTSKLNFGNIADLGGTAALFLFAKISRAATQAHVIFKKAGQYEVSINASNKVVFKVNAGAAETTLTSLGSIEITTYKTIACVYDGVKMYIYFNGVEDTNVAKTGNLVASANDFLIGSDNTNYFSGKIEVAEIRNDAPSAVSLLAKHNAPTGIKYESTKAHDLLLGDLLTDDPYNVAAVAPIRMVVTYKETDVIFHAIPILNKFNLGTIPIRRGNVNNTARDWLFETLIVSDKPYIYSKMGVKNFTNTPNASSILDLSGITDRGVLMPIMTTTQRDAISSPAAGLLIYNSTLGNFNFNDGAWKNILVENKGVAGGSIIIGGTGTTDDLILRSTSGVGVAGADIIFQVGNNGATEAMRILNVGNLVMGWAGDVSAPYGIDIVGADSTTAGLHKPNIRTTGYANANNPVWITRKSRGTYASPTTVVDGDTIGAFAFIGNKNTTPTFVYGAYFAAEVDGVPSTNVPSRFSFKTSPATGTIAQEAMRIDSAQRVGIGVTAITARLHLKAGTATASTAPLKFNSGTLLTTSEVGAVEFLTDKFYGTITTGAARQTFAMLESAQTFTGANTFGTQVEINTVAANALFIKGAQAGAYSIRFQSTTAPTSNIWDFKIRDAIEGDFQIYDAVNSVIRLYIKGNGNISLNNGTIATAVLHLAAGTAIAGTAPLKINSGINLTTPENGAIEYNGTNLFFTRTGEVREGIITQSATSAVSPTAPNRTITVNIDGSTYYIAAKTTND